MKNQQKRMWITRRQINIAKHEIESMRGWLWKLYGSPIPPTGHTFVAGGEPVGQWVYGQLSYDNSTSETAEKAMRDRRKEENRRRTEGRISVATWNKLATI